jgi:hypothetical protein
VAALAHRSWAVRRGNAQAAAFRFLSNTVYNTSSAEEQDLEAFMMVFPTDFAPVVGQQVASLCPG